MADVNDISDSELLEEVERGLITMSLQKLPSELDDRQIEEADWESAYEQMVIHARTLLTRIKETKT